MITPAELEAARRSPGTGQPPRVIKGPTVLAIDPRTGDRESAPIDCRAFNALHVHVWPSGGSTCTVRVTGSGHQGPPWMTLPSGTRTGVTDMLAFTVPVGCAWARVELVQPTGLFTVEATALVGSGLTDGPALDQGSAGDLATATNAAATVTYPAVPGLRNAITSVLVSYSAAPTGGRLTVLDGATVILDADVTAAGPTTFQFARPLTGSAGTAMSVTLAAGGGTVVGKVTVLGRDLV